jgi:alpha-tubulin suppressor-like RCC1 family protein
MGQLGLGDFYRRSTPTIIPELSNIVQIDSGGYHTLALNNIGKVYSFGSNLVISIELK